MFLIRRFQIPVYEYVGFLLFQEELVSFDACGTVCGLLDCVPKAADDANTIQPGSVMLRYHPHICLRGARDQ